jgi:RNA polymerase sigma-70 factor (ECF subfamily)
VIRYLIRWRAYDFRTDWDDIVQDVLVSTITTYREGRIENDAAFLAYVRQATRFKFVDRIRAGKHSDNKIDVEESLDRGRAADTDGWPPAHTESETASTELRLALQSALEQLSAREKAAVLAIHLRGGTYEEAARATGIPLGSLKRELRNGLARLRRILEKDGHV